MNLPINQVIHGDCLEVMKTFPSKSIDLILCDLPYGTTQNEWDSVIPLDELWMSYERLIKDEGAIILTAQTPFDKLLGASNLKLLKYEWIYEKPMATGHLNSKKMPMKSHENVLVFYKKLPTYNPQMENGIPYKSISGRNSENYGKHEQVLSDNSGERFPRSIIKFPLDSVKFHPTQKPIPLFEYLVKTYTNEGDIVLDNCAGSCTTAVACENLKRKWICIEKEEKYVKICRERIDSMTSQLF